MLFKLKKVKKDDEYPVYLGLEFLGADGTVYTITSYDYNAKFYRRNNGFATKENLSLRYSRQEIEDNIDKGAWVSKGYNTKIK